tara:strand:+ start:47367 stop:47774 length:408 start_codon:yes stop_codon:yes gene_type:complete
MKELIIGLFCLPVYEAFVALRVKFLKIDPALIANFIEARGIRDPLYQKLFFYGYTVSLPVFSCSMITLFLIHYLMKKLGYDPFTMALCFLVFSMLTSLYAYFKAPFEQDVIIAIIVAFVLATFSFSLKAKRFSLD